MKSCLGNLLPGLIRLLQIGDRSNFQYFWWVKVTAHGLARSFRVGIEASSPQAHAAIAEGGEDYSR